MSLVGNLHALRALQYVCRVRCKRKYQQTPPTMPTIGMKMLTLNQVYFRYYSYKRMKRKTGFNFIRSFIKLMFYFNALFVTI
jgi:hypothetical protein